MATPPPACEEHIAANRHISRPAVIRKIDRRPPFAGMTVVENGHIIPQFPNVEQMPGKREVIWKKNMDMISGNRKLCAPVHSAELIRRHPHPPPQMLIPQSSRLLRPLKLWIREVSRSESKPFPRCNTCCVHRFLFITTASPSILNYTGNRETLRMPRVFRQLCRLVRRSNLIAVQPALHPLDRGLAGRPVACRL